MRRVKPRDNFLFLMRELHEKKIFFGGGGGGERVVGGTFRASVEAFC